jgi:alpha-mannosidase
LQTTTNRFITAAQNKSDVSRRVIVSNEVDFFRDYVASAPSNVTPTFSAGFGNDWETNCATMAEVTAGVKRSVENLRSAEALATLVSLVDPGFVAPKTSSRDSAFINMGLYFEHNWNNDGAYSPLRPAFNRAKAAQIGNYVDGLKNDASADLARHIKHTGGEKFFVFNPLGWRRTDIADLPTTVTIQFRVVDVSTGTEVPSQVVTITGQQYVRILAQDIPSVGYRIYEIQRVASQLTDSAAVISPGNSTVENDKYRVTINGAGAISSLIDKRNGNREWVWDMMNDLGSGSGLPVPENVGSVSATLFVDAGGTLAHRTRVTLYRDIDRIDIENEITQNFFGDPPLSYSFGFNIAGYTVHHEEIGAIATAKLTSQGGSYSPTCARYEYLTLNHFVDISDATEGMTLSNWDSPFFQLGNSSVSTLDVSTPRIKAMVGGRAAPDTRGFGGQDGDTYFKNRYSLRRHDAYDQAGVMRMALEHQNPLVAEKLTGNADGPFPESNYSLLTVSDSNIVLWALKPAEEGITDVENGGIIVRAWNLAENTRAFHLTVNGTLTAALKTTHIETNLTNVAVSGSTISDTLPSQWMQTYRLYASLVPTAVQERPGSQPKSTRLFHNFPNPFNPKTTISFELDSPSHVRLTVYDLLGREVNTLVNEELGTGKHVYSLDAGRLGLGSGIYFYRLQATPDGGNVLATIGNFVDTKSMILLK